jgi:UDP-glucose 4-epimerase
MTEKGYARVLVMGGLGFIGSHLSRALLSAGYRVRIFDKLYNSRQLIADIQDEVEVEEGDMGKLEDVLASLKETDIVVGLIHTTVPASSMEDPAYDVYSNVGSYVKWLAALRGTEVKRIIYVSSGGTVYGIPRRLPVGEDHPTDPICSYGITKLAVEKYVAMYSHMYGIQYRICRPSNVYGEGQHLTIGQGAIGVFLSDCLKGRELEIWGDGEVVRDYLYVADLAEAIVGLIAHEGDGRVFNVSTGAGCSLNRIMEIMTDELKLEVKSRHTEARPYDVPVSVLDNSRLKNETHWTPRTGIVEGMGNYLKWLKKHHVG